MIKGEACFREFSEELRRKSMMEKVSEMRRRWFLWLLNLESTSQKKMLIHVRLFFHRIDFALKESNS